MTEISPMAAIDSRAQLGIGVKIGPFCCVGPDVVIGDNCELIGHVSIHGATRIGSNNVFYPHTAIGMAPQDLKYEGSPTETIIGSHNVFRECATVHRGTELGGGRTVIGSHNLFMVGSHIAHDCILEDRILLANQVQLAGHVKIETGAVISALVGVHHFVRVGRFCYVGGLTPVRRDVPPFVKFSGDPNEVRGVNTEGLKRNGFSDEDVTAIETAYRTLFRKVKNLAAGIRQLQSQSNLNPHAAYLTEFIRQSTENRFGRYGENVRRDTPHQRQRRDSAEVREKSL
jgi:UDP-N-acetylglucosamine acyltransferase